MKTNIFMLFIFISIGCNGQFETINEVLKKSVLIELPLDYKKLSVLKGDSLNEKFRNELSLSQYYLNIKGMNIANKPFSFQNLSVIGRVDLSSNYNIAIFREDYNLNDAIYYLCSFSKDGRLLSVLIIDKKPYTPSISSTINKDKVIIIKKEYENLIEKYTFILQDDGVFKRTSYSEEKL